MPFQLAWATHPSGPTGLADGLELKGAPTRIGESTPRRSMVSNALVPPLPHACAELGYTSANIGSRPILNQGRSLHNCLTSISFCTYDES